MIAVAATRCGVGASVPHFVASAKFGRGPHDDRFSSSPSEVCIFRISIVIMALG